MATAKKPVTLPADLKTETKAAVEETTTKVEAVAEKAASEAKTVVKKTADKPVTKAKKAVKTVAKKAPAVKKAATKTVTKAAEVTTEEKSGVVATAKTAVNDANERLEALVSEIRANLNEAGEALKASASIAGTKRRAIALEMLADVKENADETFASIEAMMKAESLSDSLKITNASLRAGIERNVRQVKNLAQMSAAGTKETAEPVVGYLSALRGKFSSAA